MMYLKQYNISITACDINKFHLEFSKQGIYTKDQLRYFTRYNSEKYGHFFNIYFKPHKNKKDHYILDDTIKKMVTFRSCNIAETKPKNKYDIIFFRNVLIYFDRFKKVEIMNRVKDCLTDNGYLFMGTAENPFGFEEDFETIFYKNSIVYRKKEIK